MNRTMRLPPEARALMGRKARKRMIDHFSLESVLTRWETLYRDLLGRRR